MQREKVDLLDASYNLTRDEKRAMCQWLRGEGADRFLFQHQEPSLDEGPHTNQLQRTCCHVMLMVFLLVVIRAIGLEYVKMVITRMSYFFNCITHKVIDEAELPGLKQFIIEILCQLEMCFPLSFSILCHTS